MALVLAALVVQLANPATRRQQAASHFKTASQLYDDLAAVPTLELAKRQYELVISAFEAVHRVDPSSGYCSDALLRVADLYERMADRFEDDSYRLKAVESYRLVMTKYPQSRHLPTALAALARLGAGSTADQAPPESSPRPHAHDAIEKIVGTLMADDLYQPNQVVPAPGGQNGQAVAAISALRHHSYEDGTRIVLQMDRPVALKYDRLASPERLYFDLFSSRLSGDLSRGTTTRFDDRLISSARLGQNRRTKVRLVLDLKSPISFDAFWLADPTRLVVDVRLEGSARPKRTAIALGVGGSEPEKAAPTPPPRVAETTAAGKLSLTRVLGLKPSRIVIDAGHGGHDTGAVGPRGLQEKNVVLDIAKRLGALLEANLGAEVIQTRESDVFVELEERTRIANEGDADLMVSIHCNSAPQASVRGTETYYLSLTSDPWELSVAAHENAGSERSMHELQDILTEITLDDKTEESRDLATRVQSSLHQAASRHSSRIRDRGVRKAPFVVLVGVRIPAVLVEIGFLSNASDESLMQKDSFRESVAESLYEGISAYTESLATSRMRSAAPARALDRD